MKSCARLSTAQYKPPSALDKRVTNPLQVVNLPHAGGRDRLYTLRSSISVHNAFAVRWPRYFRAPRWGFLSLDCRSLRALRLGLLMANVPLP
jgi:hypothetical protein